MESISKENVEKLKNSHWVWIASFIIYSGWYIYIYGILGHVCPAAYMGMWHTSVFLYYTWKKELPWFGAIIISFIATMFIWILSFIFLHPPISDVKVITIGPFITFLLTPFISAYLMMLFSNYTLKKKGTIEPEFLGLKFEGFWMSLTMSIGFLGTLYFMIDPYLKSLVWNDNPIFWFDTVFEIGDVWRIFMFIAAIGLFSSLCMISATLIKNKNPLKAYELRILGYTFLGLAFFGTLAVFIFINIIEHPEKIKKKGIQVRTIGKKKITE